MLQLPNPLIPFLPACAASAALTAALVRLAPRLGLIDAPSPRKVHQRPTPRGGGIALVLGVLAGALVLRPSAVASQAGLVLLGLGGAVALLGLVDDWRSLPWQLRLTVQTGAATLAVGLGPAPEEWHAKALAVLWVVGLTNAFNMLDNMDLLSGGTAWVAAACLVVLWLEREGPAAEDRLLFVVLLLGALTGFLWFNRPPARIFMGDVGSTFLGFFLSLNTLDLAGASAAPTRWLVPVCLLAVPCYDMTSVILIRLRQGRSPFHADKQHLSHRLVALGLSSPAAVALIHALALLSGLAAIGLDQSTFPVSHAALLASFATGWAAVIALDVLLARRRRGEAPS